MFIMARLITKARKGHDFFYCEYKQITYGILDMKLTPPPKNFSDSPPGGRPDACHVTVDIGGGGGGGCGSGGCGGGNSGGGSGGGGSGGSGNSGGGGGIGSGGGSGGGGNSGGGGGGKCGKILTVAPPTPGPQEVCRCHCTVHICK
jgi:hypothetical protein